VNADIAISAGIQRGDDDEEEEANEVGGEKDDREHLEVLFSFHIFILANSQRKVNT
jgi:hypothetical protein